MPPKRINSHWQLYLFIDSNSSQHQKIAAITGVDIEPNGVDAPLHSTLYAGADLPS